MTRVPPQNLEAEQAVLGTVIADPSTFDAVRHMRTDDFYFTPHRHVFDALTGMIENGKTVSLILLGDELRLRGEYAKVGESTYLAQLTSAAAPAGMLPHHAAIVTKLALRRRLIHAHAQAIELAHDPTLEVSDVFSKIEVELGRVQHTGMVRIRTAGEIAKQLIRIATSDEKPRTLADRAFSSPWLSLDRALRVHRDDVIVVAGSSSSGKSMFMGQWSDHVAWGEKAQNVLVASLEMSGEQMVQRQLMNRGNLLLDDVYSPRNDTETQKLYAAGNALQKSRVRYLDRCWDLPTILREAAAMKRREGLGMLVIDYLQIIDFSPDWGNRRDEQIGFATRRMKRFASEHEVPVVFASQLRRFDGREPSLEDLRESGNIGNDANTCLIVYRPGKIEGTPEFKRGDLRTVRIILAKQRQGQADVSIELVQQYEYSRLADSLDVDREEPEQNTMPMDGQRKPKPGRKGAHA